MGCILGLLVHFALTQIAVAIVLMVLGIPYTVTLGFGVWLALIFIKMLL